MKKSLLALSVTLCVASLTACNKPEKKIEPQNETIKKDIPVLIEDNDKIVFESFDFDSDNGAYSVCNGDAICVTETGFYYTKNIFTGTINQATYWLPVWYYCDFKTGESRVLCSLEDCWHNTATCEAIHENTVRNYVEAYYAPYNNNELYYKKTEIHNFSNFFYYRHKLYSLGYNYDTGFSLESYDADGKNKTVEKTFPCDIEGSPTEVVMDGDYMYYGINCEVVELEPFKKSYCCRMYRYDFKNDENKVIYEISGATKKTLSTKKLWDGTLCLVEKTEIGADYKNEYKSIDGDNIVPLFSESIEEELAKKAEQFTSGKQSDYGTIDANRMYQVFDYQTIAVYNKVDKSNKYVTIDEYVNKVLWDDKYLYVFADERMPDTTGQFQIDYYKDYLGQLKKDILYVFEINDMSMVAEYNIGINNLYNYDGLIGKLYSQIKMKDMYRTSDPEMYYRVMFNLGKFKFAGILNDPRCLVIKLQSEEGKFSFEVIIDKNGFETGEGIYIVNNINVDKEEAASFVRKVR